MAEPYYVGQPVRLRSEWHDPDTDALTDPTLTLRVRAPLGTITSVTPTRLSTGIWTAMVSGGVIAEPGRYAYEWVATGAASGTLQGTFEVRRSAFAPVLSVLVNLPDYDAVRTILGVTDSDVPDYLIDGPTTGQQAERLLTDAVDNWSDLLEDPATADLVKWAVEYATAALIAEQYAKGGTIGQIPAAANSQRGDWDDFAELCWGYHQRYLDMLQRAEVEAEPGILSFITEQADYDAVRDLLGTSATDMDNRTIEGLTFGQYGELLIKRRISNWEEQVEDDVAAAVLKRAAVYATTALLAESVAANSEVGKARKDDWDDFSELMWGYFEREMSEAEAEDTVPEVPFSLKLVHVGGSYRRNRRRYGAWPHTAPYIG